MKGKCAPSTLRTVGEDRDGKIPGARAKCEFRVSSIGIASPVIIKTLANLDVDVESEANDWKTKNILENLLDTVI